ncbi:Por secretion system C-terminal sorting domain-containing protein [Flavobacterium segetis]|uniref:Por secretion system C-terminal sorting domain-containing protein n=1 Tax=Flavobacterium segetis TaxID=271157 RepID=A0A1M5HTQ3_9FLAO|nr:T9SS type A sorting domain-containing protein [Flavobacterium segetis]SHG19320.1 Por secretion system C-terminal sorting domain-containing protein [Flavobacterium segetis]
MKYLLLLFCSTFYGQTLHHQMISSQGKSAILSNGLLVKQTIGQQSISGNSKGEYIVVQGFQQNYWAKIIAESPLSNDMIVTTYPNPFVALINFRFSKAIKSEMMITVFDVSGRLIIQQVKNVEGEVLTIDLSRLPNAIYLVRLNNNEINYYTKIAKSL